MLPDHSSEPGGEATLTIAQLSERTGVAQATLRAWEVRHGVPTPQRLASGHRRYANRDAELIAAAAEHRRHGLSVAAALARARANLAGPPASVFATLRESRPELAPQTMERSALAGVSRAIEDECLARAIPGLLIGGFQREVFYRRSEARWRKLAASMVLTIVLADFQRRRGRGAGPCEVPFAEPSPLALEWVLIAPVGCVLARERAPHHRGSRQRVFDAIWSPEPEVAYGAARIAIGLLGHHGLSERALQALGPEPAPSSPELRRAAALTNRIVGYVS